MKRLLLAGLLACSLGVWATVPQPLTNYTTGIQPSRTSPPYWSFTPLASEPSPTLPTIIYLSGTGWRKYTPGEGWSDLGGESPLTFSAPLSRVGNTISIPAADATHNGYLRNTDWNTFNNKQAPLGYTPVNKAGDFMQGFLAMNSRALLINPGTIEEGYVDWEIVSHFEGGRYVLDFRHDWPIRHFYIDYDHVTDTVSMQADGGSVLFHGKADNSDTLDSYDSSAFGRLAVANTWALSQTLLELLTFGGTTVNDVGWKKSTTGGCIEAVRGNGATGSTAVAGTGFLDSNAAAWYLGNASNGLGLSNSHVINWSSTALYNSPDVGLARNSSPGIAHVLDVTQGDSNYGWIASAGQFLAAGGSHPAAYYNYPWCSGYYGADTRMVSSWEFKWASAGDTRFVDVGLARGGPGRINITNGSTGWGELKLQGFQHSLDKWDFGTNFRVYKDFMLGWGPNADYTSTDTGLMRASAGNVAATTDNTNYQNFVAYRFKTRATSSSYWPSMLSVDALDMAKGYKLRWTNGNYYYDTVDTTLERKGVAHVQSNGYISQGKRYNAHDPRPDGWPRNSANALDDEFDDGSLAAAWHWYDASHNPSGGGDATAPSGTSESTYPGFLYLDNPGSNNTWFLAKSVNWTGDFDFAASCGIALASSTSWGIFITDSNGTGNAWMLEMYAAGHYPYLQATCYAVTTWALGAAGYSQTFYGNPEQTIMRLIRSGSNLNAPWSTNGINWSDYWGSTAYGTGTVSYVGYTYKSDYYGLGYDQLPSVSTDWFRVSAP